MWKSVRRLVNSRRRLGQRSSKIPIDYLQLVNVVNPNYASYGVPLAHNSFFPLFDCIDYADPEAISVRVSRVSHAHGIGNPLDQVAGADNGGTA